MVAYAKVRRHPQDERALPLDLFPKLSQN